VYSAVCRKNYISEARSLFCLVPLPKVQSLKKGSEGPMLRVIFILMLFEFSLTEGSESQKGKSNLKDVHINGKIILKLMFEK
jgi:hypothetical protein